VQNFFQSPALAQLTHFELSGESSDMFYDNFKWDLLQLLHNAPNLTTLRIYCGPIEEDDFRVYPEMLPQIQSIHFPKLSALHLSTRMTIFTRKELELWGCQQGWPELQHLTLSRAADLIPFVSQVPRLTYLHVTAHLGVGMAKLSRCLDLTSSNSRPLGALDSLVYNHFLTRNFSSSRSHVVPWLILNKVKDSLTRYHSVHQPYEVFLPGFATPSGHDLRLMQEKCPKLTDLAVDVDVNTDEYEGTEVLQAFAEFSGLAKLMLYVHRPMNHAYWSPTNPEWHFDSEADCAQAYSLIMRGCAKTHPYLVVEFKEMFDYAHVGSSRYAPSWTFWVDDTGQPLYCNTAAQPEVRPVEGYKLRQIFAHVTDRVLKDILRLERKQARFNGFRSWTVGHLKQDLEGALGVELKRRKKAAKLGNRLGDVSFTLYDRLMGKQRL
jgi:hypothetical protein